MIPHCPASSLPCLYKAGSDNHFYDYCDQFRLASLNTIQFFTGSSFNYFRVKTHSFVHTVQFLGLHSAVTIFASLGFSERPGCSSDSQKSPFRRKICLLGPCSIQNKMLLNKSLFSSKNMRIGQKRGKIAKRLHIS